MSFGICFVNRHLCQWYFFQISVVSIFLHWSVHSGLWRCFLESMLNCTNFQKCNSYESHYFAFRHLLYPLSSVHASSISFKYQRYQWFLLESVLSADDGFLNHLSTLL